MWGPAFLRPVRTCVLEPTITRSLKANKVGAISIKLSFLGLLKRLTVWFWLVENRSKGIVRISHLCVVQSLELAYVDTNFVSKLALVNYLYAPRTYKFTIFVLKCCCMLLLLTSDYLSGLVFCCFKLSWAGPRVFFFFHCLKIEFRGDTSFIFFVATDRHLIFCSFDSNFLRLTRLFCFSEFVSMKQHNK